MSGRRTGDRPGPDVARVAAFFFVIAVLGWLSNIPPGRQWVARPLTGGLAAAAERVIRIGGGEARAAGTMLYGSHVALDIKDGCNGLIAMILYVGAVAAHAASPAWKALGLALGLPLIWLLNLLRIVMLYLLAIFAPARAEFFHLYVWQCAIIVCVAAIWLAWAETGLRLVTVRRAAASNVPH